MFYQKPRWRLCACVYKAVIVLMDSVVEFRKGVSEMTFFSSMMSGRIARWEQCSHDSGVICRCLHVRLATSCAAGSTWKAGSAQKLPHVDWAHGTKSSGKSPSSAGAQISTVSILSVVQKRGPMAPLPAWALSSVLVC